MNEELKYIEIEHIHPHPDNPRKDLGDLTELVESVKKNGIMQNLTVIPMESMEGEFMTLIGHRRSAAARLAGIKEVPCRIIRGMSLREQVSTMLEENMQRNDLTIYEQAQGFQMMLDLGETEDSIAEKTGFSKSTIRRRLCIAKLDPVLLKKKEQDDSFQLTLKDLYELDKIEDVQIKNKILDDARSSQEIAWRVRNAATKEKQDKAAKMVIEMLETKGIKKAPSKVVNERWSSKWDTLKEINLNHDIPEDITYKAKKTDEVLYVRWNDWTIGVIRKAEKRKETKAEKEAKEREKKKKEIRTICKEMDRRRQEFVQCIVNGDIKSLKDEVAVRDEIWNCIRIAGGYITNESLEYFFRGKSRYESSKEEIREAEAKAKSCSVLLQMLIIMHKAMSDKDLCNYDGTYRAEVAAGLIPGYEMLKKHVWVFEKGEESILDGSSELYSKEK